ncbi:MAG: hypothetical protein NTV87_12520, partial [Ignavibacteriae bacterium]|nr:hypothetical protein [Ignavibacteriota bacterium]
MTSVNNFSDSSKKIKYFFLVLALLITQLAPTPVGYSLLIKNCFSQESWTATSTTNAPSARERHSAVWSGTSLIIWGGAEGTGLSTNSGGVYNYSSDTWTPTSLTNAPASRLAHIGVWTGTKMVVWGGNLNGSYLSTGGVYDPALDTWTPTATANSPSGGNYPSAIWTGSKMIVWGGYNGSYLNTGGLYDPSSNINYYNTGAIYDPAGDTWTPISTNNAPAGRIWQTAVWTGSKMIIWGGYANTVYYNTGGIYDPAADTWTP